MPDQTRTVAPGPDDRTVRSAAGQLLRVPAGWALLPPGDATCTRRVKCGGPSWTVQEKKGRRTFSRGVWAPKERIDAVRASLEVEREDPAYRKRLEAGRRRRAAEQVAYIDDFVDAVREFLAFAPVHRELGDRVAHAIAAHATPVGSGTVARTKRIPIARRAEAATIAWLRHQTTAYDSMHIPRVRGMRREVRRLLAEESRRLLRAYREGGAVDPQLCPLHAVLWSRSGSSL